MVWWEDQLPAIAMVLTQCIAATMAMLTRAALLKGMSPRVFIFHRQAIATLFMSPIAYFTRGRSNRSCMGIKCFLLIFITAFIGVVFNQTVYFEGLYLASSSIACAMSNLAPALTFLIAAISGLEQVNLKRLSSIAKISGTILCVGGAISMALLRGPKLLNYPQLPSAKSLVLHVLRGETETWLMGCIFLFASSCCWSLFLVLQVPITECYPDYISLSAWMSFLSMLQAGIIAFFLERDPKVWDLSSSLELTCCFFSGIFGSGFQFFIQSWCVSHRGPFFSAMFSPLCTVITTALAGIILHEDIYIGSLLGSILVIMGLYVVLWGKAKEMKRKLDPKPEIGPSNAAQEKTSCKIDLEEPLLANNNCFSED